MKCVNQSFRRQAVALLTLLALAGWLFSARLVRRANASLRDVGVPSPVLPDAATKRRVSEGLRQLPMSFEVNRGQTDARVKFLARGGGYAVFLTPGEAVLSLRRSANEKSPRRSKEFGASPAADAAPAVVRLRLVGANPAPEVTGREPLPSRSNYYIGSDPAKWQTGVAHFAKVEYREVYPSINQVFYGNQGQLEYDFVVAPGASPAAIRLRYEGAGKVRINEQGDLVLKLAGGELRQHRPCTYQEVNGERRTVASRYVLRGRNQVGIAVADYDTSKPLVIDPVLVYSTYLGGSGQEAGYGIAADYSFWLFPPTLRDTVYITGSTASPNFPTQEPTQAQPGGETDAFVLGLHQNGRELGFATYLGGSGRDGGYGIRFFDGLFVAGTTASPNFPTRDPTQPNYGGGESDAFVAHLFPESGRLLFSTFIGGSGKDTGYGLGYRVSAPSNLVYVTGSTNSTNFGATAGSFQTTYGGGNSDAFVVHLDIPGSDAFPLRPPRIVYSTYLGGSGDDVGYAIEGGLSPTLAGNSYRTSDYPLIVGATSSTNFPLRTPTQSAYGGGESDAFVARISPDGKGLGFSTYLGGSGKDVGYAITLGNDEREHGASAFRLKAYLTGSTSSPDFPTKDPLQSAYGGGESDAFVVKMAGLFGGNPQVVYSTYLGGSGRDVGYGVAVPLEDTILDLPSLIQIFVTGATDSTNFPLKDATQPAYGGGSSDAFVTYIKGEGRRLDFSTYFGGSGQDVGYGIAYDNLRDIGNATQGVYLTGQTDSPAGIATPGAFQPGRGGGSDAFIACFRSGRILSLSPDFQTIPANGGTRGMGVRLNQTQGSATQVSLTSSNPAVASVPASVTIPAGQSDIGFNVTGGAAGGPVIITATTKLPDLPGSSSATASVSVSADPPTLTFSPATQSIQAGFSATLRLALNIAQDRDVSVTLASSDSARAVPVFPSVTFPAGSISETFGVRTNDTSAAGVVTITATLPAALGGGSARADINITPGCTPTPINFGQPVSGTLSASDCLSPRSLYRADRYSFSAPAGHRIAISLQSAGFNPSLALLWAGNKSEVNNGDNGSASVARLPQGHGFFTLPLSGTYTIEVTPRDASQTGDGDYVLSLERASPVPELSVDDGTYEDALGLTNGGTITFINRLTPASYPATLTDVAIFFRTAQGPRASDALTLLVAAHPGGGTNIDGAAFQSVSGMVRAVAQYSVYDVPDLTINAGDFLVGFRITHAEGVFPAAYDKSPPSKQRSYVSTDGSAFQIIDNVGSQFAGNFGIRARLTPPAVTSASAASYSAAELATESIVSAFGTNLAAATQAAAGLPLPTELAGTSVRVRDSAGVERLAPLFFVSPLQVNYQLPPGTALGLATVTITNSQGQVALGPAPITQVAPGLFAANADGRGVAAALVQRIKADGMRVYEEIVTRDAATNRFIAKPIDLGPEGEQVFLELYGTGIRKRSALAAVQATVGGAPMEVLYAGEAPGWVGLDQVNVRLARSLIGRGEVDLVLTVDGRQANTVRIHLR